jgi:putative ABC transport system permease protein
LGLDKEPEPELYLPTTQFMVPGLQIGLVVHGLADVSRLRRPIEREIAAIDPELPESRIRTVQELVAESTASHRFSTVLLSAFAAIAFLLAATGLYSVLAYSVTQRRKEIGIRVALGARRADVLRLVMAEGAQKAIAGIAAGGLAAFVLSGALKALVFGVSPAEPWIYAAAGGLLFTVALIAGLIPAVRAMRVDPIQTLSQN